MQGKVDLEIAKRLYEGGATLAKVGEHFGVSKQAIHKLLNYHGITTRPGKVSPIREKIISLRNSGLTQRQIALELGVSQPAVSVTLIRAGLRTNRRRHGE